MRFLNMKIITIIILSIFLLLGIFFIYYNIALKNEIMEVQLKDIEVYPLKEFVDYEDDLNNYGLSKAEKKEILNNIDNYKEVIYIFELKNTSSWLAQSVHHRVQPLFSERTKKILIANESNFSFPQNLPPGESYKTMLITFIKADNQLSDQEILEIVSKDRFTIIGDRIGIFSVKPAGEDQVTVGPFYKNQ